MADTRWKTVLSWKFERERIEMKDVTYFCHTETFKVFAGFSLSILSVRELSEVMTSS